MRNLISVVFFFAISASLFQPAFASDISNPERGFFLLSGEIQKGDADKLAKVFIQYAGFEGLLTLDSPGGDVEEALRIASFVKALHLQTRVAGGGTCASACFFIFLAGIHHIAVGTKDGRMTRGSLGYIGLHRPYFKLDSAKRSGSTDAEMRQHGVMQKSSDYLRNEDVPQRLIDLMMSRPSNDIYWMTQDDIDQLGDYSPGFEELLISRCGYSRHMVDDIRMEWNSNDPAIAARGHERAKAFGECQVNAFPDLKEETIKNIERLRKGWRPWLKSKVAGK
jgi:hypothetical protein